MQILNAAGPVNYQHPLNRGLISLWVAMPQPHARTGFGSRMWLDLAKGNNHGVLTGGPTWIAPISRSPVGALNCVTASIQYAALTDVASLHPTGGVTVMAWVQCRTTASERFIFGHGNLTTYLSNSQAIVANQASTTSTILNPGITAGVQTFVAMTWDLVNFTVYKAVSGGPLTQAATAAFAGTSLFQTISPCGIGAYNPNTRPWDGTIGMVAVFDHGLTAKECEGFYGQTLLGYPDVLSWIRPAPAVFTSGPATYTGTSAVTTGAATASGSATFTAPVYTATAADTVGPTTASGTATFTAPVYTATSAVTIGPAAASGTATFTAPVYTATSAVSVGAATASGSATFTAPVYSGTSAVTVGPASASGTATFTAAAVYTGSSAVTIGPVTVAAAATFVAPVYTGASAVTVGAATGAGVATFTAPVYTGTSTVTIGTVAAFGSATFVAAGVPVRGPHVVMRRTELETVGMAATPAIEATMRRTELATVAMAVTPAVRTTMRRTPIRTVRMVTEVAV